MCQYTDGAKALIAGNGSCAASGLGGKVANNCDPDYQQWRLASRTMWNPVANLDVGLEIAYSKTNTAFAGAATIATQNGLAGGAGNPYAIEDLGVWSGAIRVQRSFWP